MLIKRYNVDFKAYMRLCELNYHNCMKLLQLNEDYMSYRVELPGRHQAEIRLKIKQRCKYTTMLVVEKVQLSPWLVDLHFDLRLYHDAGALEIMAHQNLKTKKIRYQYPNKQMFHQDEKVQQQEFLAECLRYCLQYGLSDVKLNLA